jgi:hypothetical protein
MIPSEGSTEARDAVSWLAADCLPHPPTILDGLIRILGRIEAAP